MIFSNNFKITNILFLNSAFLLLLTALCSAKHYRDVNELKRNYLKPFMSYLNEDAVFYCPIRTKNEIILVKKRQLNNSDAVSDGNIQYNIIKQEKKTLLKRNVDDKLEKNHNIDRNDYVAEQNIINDSEDGKINNLQDLLKSINKDLNFYEKDKFIKYSKRNIKEGLEKLKLRNPKRKKKSNGIVTENYYFNNSDQNIKFNEALSSKNDNTNDIHLRSRINRRNTRYLKNIRMHDDHYYDFKTLPPLKPKSEISKIDSIVNNQVNFNDNKTPIIEATNNLNNKVNFNINKKTNLDGTNRILTQKILSKIASKRSDAQLLNLLNSFTNNNNSSSETVNALLTGLNSFFTSNSDKSNHDNNLNRSSVFLDKGKKFTPVNNNKEHVINTKLNVSTSIFDNNLTGTVKSKPTVGKTKLMIMNSKPNRFDEDYENGKDNYSGIGTSISGNSESKNEKNANDIEGGEKLKPSFDVTKKLSSKNNVSNTYRNSELSNLNNSNFTQTIIELKDKYNNNNVSSNYGDMVNITKSDGHTLDSDENISSFLVDHPNDNSIIRSINENNYNNTVNFVNNDLNNLSASNLRTDSDLAKHNFKIKKVYSDLSYKNKDVNTNINGGVSSMLLKSNGGSLFQPTKTTARRNMWLNNMNFNLESQQFSQAPGRYKINSKFIVNNDNKSNTSSPLVSMNGNNQFPGKTSLLKNITVNLTCADEIKVNATINFNYENNSAPAALQSSMSSSAPYNGLTDTVGTSGCSSTPGKFDEDESATSCGSTMDQKSILSTLPSISMCIALQTNSINGLTTMDILNFDNMNNKVAMNPTIHNKGNFINENGINSYNINENFNASHRVFNSSKKKVILTTTSSAILNQNATDNLHLKIMVQNMGNGIGASDNIAQSIIKQYGGVGTDVASNLSNNISNNNLSNLKGSLSYSKSNYNTNIMNSTKNYLNTIKLDDDYEDEDYIYSNTKSSLSPYSIPTMIV